MCSDRHGARHIPTPACHGRHQRTGRGAPSRLRGHHSREATLYVTRAAVRAQWGQASDMMPSQFLDEIPDELIDWKRREAGVERMRASWQDDDDEFGGWDDDDDSDRCHSAVPRMESRIIVPHTVPARGGLVPHTDRLHMGQGARSTAARLRRAHHPRMVPHPGARAEDREPVPHTARMVRMAPASQEGNRARSPRDVSSRKQACGFNQILIRKPGR